MNPKQTRRRSSCTGSKRQKAEVQLLVTVKIQHEGLTKTEQMKLADSCVGRNRHCGCGPHGLYDAEIENVKLHKVASK